MKLLLATLATSACLLVATTMLSGQKSETPPAAGEAQSTKAAVAGQVSDQGGVALKGATVMITSRPARSLTKVTTDENGLYAVTDLEPGLYTVTVLVKNTKVLERDIALSPGEIRTFSVAGSREAKIEGNPAPAADAVDASQQSPPPAGQPGDQTPTAAAQSGAGQNANAAPSANARAQDSTKEQSGGAAQSSGTTIFPPPAEPVMPVLAGAPATATMQAGPSVASCTGPGTIGGTVSDQSGAVLVGAAVKLTNSSGAVRNTVSDDKGNYCFKELPQGTYKLSVAMANFKSFEADTLTLAAGAELPIDAMLEPAAAVTEVEVTGQKVAAVETEKAEVSGTITEKEVKTLALNGRNFTQLIALAPGVSNQTGQDEAKVGVTGSVKYSVNGGRVEYNTFEVDGSDVLNAGLNGAESTLVVYPSLDAIQEVKVLTSNYGAMYGRTASGTVLVTTKSGGDHWHGSGYEFWRNEALNARNYFDQTTKAPLYRRNDLGFTIGGPIKKGTYIFGSEEFRIEKSPTDQQPDFNRAVPSLAERNGNFNDVCPAAGTPYFFRSAYPDCPSPGGTSLNTGALAPFPNNSLNIGGAFGTLDPNSVALLSTNLIPLPNASSGCNSTTGSCYNVVISEPTNWREDMVRLDHDFNTRTRASLRFIHDSWNTTVPVPQWQHLPGNVVNSFPTVQNKFIGPGISAIVRVTQTITATLLNEATASFVNSNIILTNVNGPGASFARPSAIGQPGGSCTSLGTVNAFVTCPMGAFFNNGFKGKAPGIIISGNNQEYGGAGFTADTSYMPWQHTNPTYSFRDDLTKAIGKHTLQLGALLILSQKNETNSATGAATGDTQGLLTFSNVGAGLDSTGNAFANLLWLTHQTPFGTSINSNVIQSYTQDSTQQRYYSRYTIGEPYAQDDWKINPRVTLNLGVRFSLFGLFYEKYNKAYNWDPAAFSASLASQVTVDPTSGALLDATSLLPIPLNLSNLDPRITNGMVHCGVNGVHKGCMSGHLFNPAPRIGLAWDPFGNGKTSIRAGYGMFFEHGTGEESNTGSLEGSAPLVLSVTQSYPQSYGCIGNAAPGCVASPGAFPLNVTSIPTKVQWSYAQQWSLSAQRELPRSMIATIAYVGSKGTHLSVERQLNQLPPLAGSFNPFGINQPLIPQGSPAGAGDCAKFRPPQPGVPAQFILNNGITVGPQNPAFVNLAAACAGEAFVNSSGNATLATPNVNTLRPYPGIGQIFALQNVANSGYNALQATLRRTRGPLTIGGSYSYSHSFDNASDRSDTTLVNSYDLRSNRASSNFDQRHLLSVSYIYTLPALSKSLQAWTSGHAGEPTGDSQDSHLPEGSSRVLRVLGDGWEFSGITVFQSGTPFSVINGGGAGISVLDNAGVANGVSAGSYPDLANNRQPTPNEHFNSQSFGPLIGNPNIFVAPRGLTFGNAGRNFLSNPHRINFDMSLLKHFQVTEGSFFEFRAEAFNIFNHSQFRIYDPNLGNTGSNVISCYGGPNYAAGYSAPLDPASGLSTGTDCVTGSAFLHPVDAHRPRTMQLGLKYVF